MKVSIFVVLFPLKKLWVFSLIANRIVFITHSKWNFLINAINQARNVCFVSLFFLKDEFQVYVSTLLYSWFNLRLLLVAFPTSIWVSWSFCDVSSLSQMAAALSGLMDLLKHLLLLLEDQLVCPGLQAQGPAALRMECVTSVWCGVRPARRSTSAGRAMRCWSPEDEQSLSKTWRGRILEKVKLNYILFPYQLILTVTCYYVFFLNFFNYKCYLNVQMYHF